MSQVRSGPNKGNKRSGPVLRFKGHEFPSFWVSYYLTLNSEQEGYALGLTIPDIVFRSPGTLLEM